MYARTESLGEGIALWFDRSAQERWSHNRARIQSSGMPSARQGRAVHLG